MNACPQCGAICDATSERCASCGSFLPQSGTIEPIWSKTKLSQPVPTEASGSPPRELPDSSPPQDKQSSVEFIRPRKLSPEYAERVTAHWERTDAEYRHPQETIHSDADTTEQEERLRIGERSVVNVDSDERGDYELLDTIGEGGMGVVWSARQSSLNRDVAIKYPKRKVGQTEQQKNKFIFEVVVTGRLDHPNIVPIYDLARDTEGQLFYAMKRVDGRPWNTCIHEGSLSFEQNIEILMKVCDAIRFAHDRDVIHCDIKPHNIMVGRYGEVSVMDFGAAVRLVNGIAVASAGGTFSYMAPEIASDSRGQLCPATDVYLLGAVLYEILTGEPPHPPPADSKDRAQMFRAAAMIAARNEIRPISVGGELAEIAHKALATDIADRYQRVDDFQRAIRDYLSHAESIALAERGRQHLRNATDESHGAPKTLGARFDEFDRARFAFEEAVTLWPENEPAKAGLSEAIIASAKYALQQGAFSRGIALLDAQNPKHARLLGRLHSARRRNERAWSLLRAAVIVIIVGGATLSSFLYIQWTETEIERSKAVELRELADKNRTKAEENAENALDNAEIALVNEWIAGENAIDAANQASLARKNERTALANEELAKNESRRAERNSYISDIGVADKALRQNDFNRVDQILSDQALRETRMQRNIRGWEWGFLNFFAKERPQQRFLTRERQRYESATISEDSRFVVAGTVDGNIYVWRNADTDLLLAELSYGTRVRSVAIVQAGEEYLIAAGGTAQARTLSHPVKIWRITRQDATEEIPTKITHPSPILSVAFSGDSKNLVASDADGKAVIWDLGTGNRLATLHVADKSRNVWSARFSPSGNWIVTAADDGKVCVWDRQGTKWEQFSDHKHPVLSAGFVPAPAAEALPGSELPLFVVSGDEAGHLFVGKFDRKEPGEWRDVQNDEIKNNLVQRSAESTASKMTQIGKHAASIEDIDFSPGGKFIFSSSNDNTVAVWDASAAIENVKRDPIKVLRGHGGWVHACAAIGQTLADSRVLSAGYDGRVLLWDWQKYNAPRVLTDDSEGRLASSKLTSAAVSSDRKWIATGAENGIVTMWNMQNWSDPIPQDLREGHDWQARTGIFFSDGQRLLTSAGDNSTLVWNVEQGQQLRRLGRWDGDGTGWRGVAAISHDGQRIATGSNPSGNGNRSGTPTLAKIWDASTGNKLATVEGALVDLGSGPEPTEATALDFALDDRMLFVGDQWGASRLVEASSGRVLREFPAHRSRVVAARFLPNGHTLLTAAADGQIRKWDTSAQSPRPIYQLQHGNQVVALDVSADGQHFISASDSKANGADLRLWDAITGRQENSLNLEKNVNVRSVAFHPQHRVALVNLYEPETATRRCRIGQWHWAEKNRPLELVPVPAQLGVSMAVYSPRRRDRFLAVGGHGARFMSLSQSDQSRNELPTANMTFRPLSGVNSVAFSQNGETLASVGRDGSVKFWQFDDGRWKAGETIPANSQEHVNSILGFPNRADRFVAATNGGLQVVQKVSDRWSLTPTSGGNDKPMAVTQLAYSSDGNFLAAATADHGALVFDQNLKLVWLSPQEVLTDVQSVGISPDGAWIVAASAGKIWLCKREGDQKHVEIVGHPADVTSICFSQDSDRLFTASQDFTVKVWDISSITHPEKSPQGPTNQPTQLDGKPQELMTLAEHQGIVTSVQFVPETELLLTTGLDGQAILWPCDMGGVGQESLTAR